MADPSTNAGSTFNNRTLIITTGISMLVSIMVSVIFSLFFIFPHMLEGEVARLALSNEVKSLSNRVQSLEEARTPPTSAPVAAAAAASAGAIAAAAPAK